MINLLSQGKYTMKTLSSSKIDVRGNLKGLKLGPEETIGLNYFRKQLALENYRMIHTDSDFTEVWKPG